MSQERSNWTAFAIILSVSAVLFCGYFYRIHTVDLERRLELHNQIVNASAQSPYCYRVLVPFLCDILTKLFSRLLSPANAFLLSYAMYDFAAIVFLLAVLFIYLRVNNTFFSIVPPHSHILRQRYKMLLISELKKLVTFDVQLSSEK